MNKWMFPVCLCMLFLAVTGAAQELVINQTLPVSSNLISDSEKSIIYQTATTSKHSTLLTVLKASDLDDVLGYKGQFTIFAPSNLAFEKLSDVTFQKLLDPKNKKELIAILSGHIIAKKLSASSILRSMSRGRGKATFTTIQGAKLTATMNGTDIILTDTFGNKAKIMAADTNQSNGVIHEIDSVLLSATSIQ